MIVLNEKAKPKEPVIDLNLGIWGCPWVNVLVASSKITTNEKVLVMRDAQKVWNNAGAKRRELMLKAKTCDCFLWDTSEEGSEFWAHIFKRHWS